MPNRKVQFLIHRAILLPVLVLGMITLQCCGSLTRGEKDDLDLSLTLPSSEEPSLFWFGVKRKTLRIHRPEGESWEQEWGAGERFSLELRQGDILELIGTDESGRVLVSGQATVGLEKKITIPLQRVL